MKNYLRLMRVHHWIKNILVIIPIIFSGDLFQKILCQRGVLGMLCFSLLSSSIYIVNDIQDAEKDRRHPTKCKRPIASGEISVKSARGLLMVLLGIVILITIYMEMLWKIERITSLYLIIYFVLNLSYSVGLKNVPLVDIAILVSGFLIRVLYGAGITQTKISDWLFLTVMSGAFFFSLGKRRNELGTKTDTRTVLRHYDIKFLDKNMYVCLSLLNVFYALWCRDSSEGGGGGD